MKNTIVAGAGIGGLIAAVVCCAAPVLIGTLGGVSLSVLAARFGYFVLPVLGTLLCVTAYVLWRRKRSEACCARDLQANKERT